MSGPENISPTVAAILGEIRALSLPDMQAVLTTLKRIYQERLEEQEELYAKAAELAARFDALGLPRPDLLASLPAGEVKGKRRAPVKYRSRKDPTLTWSGRGHVARWLEREMDETGLSLEQFRVGGED